MLNCEDPPVDICLTIDQTKSVMMKNYQTMMENMKTFLGYFPISKEKTNFAIVTFNRKATVRVSFKDEVSKNMSLLQQVLTDMKSDQLGKPTRTDKALITTATDVFNEKNGDRPNSPDVMVLITDGRSHPESLPLDEAVEPLKVSRMTTCSVFVLDC